MQTMEGHARLLEEYQPQPYAGQMRTLLFRNTQGFVGESGMLAGNQFAGVGVGEKDYGWSRWLPHSPEVVEIPANHFSLGQDPAIGLVAQELARRLTPGIDPGQPGVSEYVDGSPSPRVRRPQAKGSTSLARIAP